MSITNPTTTEPTDSFVFQIKNSNNFLVNTFSDLKLTTTKAATMTTASLSQSSKDASATVDVTFTIQLTHAVPAGGMINIFYPSEVTVEGGTLSVSLISPTAATLTSSLTSSERKIQVTDMFTSGAASGATYQFTVKNVKNTASSTATASWQIITYTSSTGAYRIDEVTTGLTMTAN